MNPDIQGPDVDSYNPDRFLYSMNGSKTLLDGTVPEGRRRFVHPGESRIVVDACTCRSCD